MKNSEVGEGSRYLLTVKRNKVSFLFCFLIAVCLEIGDINSFREKDRADSSLLLGFGRIRNPSRLLGQIICHKTRLTTSSSPLSSATVENLTMSSKVSSV